MVIPHLPQRETRAHLLLSYCLGIVLIGMLVLQLYTFDEFSEPIAVLLPASMSEGLIAIIPAIIVVVELIALSYAMPLYLSRLARLIGRVATCIVPALWALLLLLPLARSQAGLYPLLGTKIPLQIDVISFVPIVMLATLTAIVVYYDIARRRS